MSDCKHVTEHGQAVQWPVEARLEHFDLTREAS